MIEIKKIMVPVDFSRESLLAARFGVSLSHEYNSELIVFHVIPPFHPIVRAVVPEYDSMKEKALASAQKELGGVIPQEVKKTLKKIDEIVVVGEPHIAIPAHAQKLGVDMIVLGTHGRTGLAHVILGSVAERVIRHAPCPVLVVRNNVEKYVHGWG
ncbi:MAG: universal stress protein [Deltaproteobacteria bacterium]|nr:universal stress protein [Deltaproteobacteria bacterium]MBW2308964.1 universal stress protein [Deltaproteobacteria bacterium]